MPFEVLSSCLEYILLACGRHISLCAFFCKVYQLLAVRRAALEGWALSVCSRCLVHGVFEEENLCYSFKIRVNVCQSRGSACCCFSFVFCMNTADIAREKVQSFSSFRVSLSSSSNASFYYIPFYVTSLPLCAFEASAVEWGCARQLIQQGKKSKISFPPQKTCMSTHTDAAA